MAAYLGEDGRIRIDPPDMIISSEAQPTEELQQERR